ncbi:MAG: gamma-glutamylcyclotransferase [Spirosomataceae bacterium]|jgi:gamma-glutamylcyclotransferase (GGCT)/AIG2-like uncharacterized protein YtfP
MPTSNNPEYLFVYGTLMKRYAENPFVNEIEQFAYFHSTAFTTGELYLISHYPGLIKTETFEFVYGELFVIRDSKELFSILDPYESCEPNDDSSSQYLREQIDVFTKIRQPALKAWTYIFNKPVNLLRRIKSGDFLDF